MQPQHQVENKYDISNNKLKNPKHETKDNLHCEFYMHHSPNERKNS